MSNRGPSVERAEARPAAGLTGGTPLEKAAADLAYCLRADLKRPIGTISLGSLNALEVMERALSSGARGPSPSEASAGNLATDEQKHPSPSSKGEGLKPQVRDFDETLSAGRVIADEFFTPTNREGEDGGAS